VVVEVVVVVWVGGEGGGEEDATHSPTGPTGSRSHRASPDTNSLMTPWKASSDRVLLASHAATNRCSTALTDWEPRVVRSRRVAASRSPSASRAGKPRHRQHGQFTGEGEGEVEKGWGGGAVTG
jgi:hypothetical protein